MRLREEIEAIAARPGNDFTPQDRTAFKDLKYALNRGEIRAAEKTESGKWQVNSWVKLGILLGFRMGVITDMSEGESFKFFDKNTYPARPTRSRRTCASCPVAQRFETGFTSRPVLFVCRRCS